ncbi:MAG TPA: nucleoside-diphosphate kinase [Actinokineospora sp.]|jgi:hypothetical protein|nr:nucleoside-diphosphate kinase [Actinokineospora sp.]
MATITVPSALSRLPEKIAAFAADPYFRDAWDDLSTVVGDGSEIAALLADAAPLVLRPDALVSGRARRVLESVYAAGFTPVAMAWFTFSRHVIRETWRYQLNVATRDRIDVMDMVLRGEDAVYILLEKPDRPRDVPATSLLSDMKGPSAPEDRRPEHLRSLAGSAQESVLTYVHVADEPADIVRELGVFFDRPQRRKLFGSLGARRDLGESVIAEIDDRTRTADLGYDTALSRLARLAEGQPGLAQPLIRLLSRIEAGDGSCWRDLLDHVERTGLPLSRWGKAAIAARLGARHLDATPTVPDVKSEAWSVQ